MALGPRLDIRQSQSLVMTPQLQLAIKLLALSNLELESYLSEALDSNILLEMAQGDGSLPSTSAEDDSDHHSADGDSESLSGDGGEIEGGADLDADAESFSHDFASDRLRASGDRDGVRDGMDFDSFAGHEASLQDYLLQQAGQTLSGMDLAIAAQIIGLIDEAGYVRGDLADVAADLVVPLADVETVLHQVQGFDPTGVGARDLAECLALQAREADRYDPAMAAMIAHLDLLGRGALAQLKRICGVDDEDLADMIRELRGYDPKPGLRYGGVEVQSVVPDLYVRPSGSGWLIEMNSANLPRLLVNRRYYQQLIQGAAKPSRAWLSEQLASANWLVRALDQRQQTIIKVASEIVKQQDGFFRHGIAQMRPLTLRQVADAIAMHESTVSRVTSHKYLSCARGVFELKYFFSSGIGVDDGKGAVSAEVVKSRIRALIESEDGGKILSDEALARKLADEGYDIARRTVVKYREAMGFGSSVQRRRQKALAG